MDKPSREAYMDRAMKAWVDNADVPTFTVCALHDRFSRISFDALSKEIKKRGLQRDRGPSDGKAFRECHVPGRSRILDIGRP